ncbi:hypothetical protein [Bifidobacterium sp. ESL0790]|uniref:hypothetical protein n=1 Tax=Bifidobacterium sp. ESL0790 TaxID=2983233 RepID=UPI0023FA2DF7|nr:hypothetical protein [Bifidobacterium sp. ESL0790]WEV72677.1 hypothetical protein OZY47_01440 [Bifidobacterium sp. ESL0790]
MDDYRYLNPPQQDFGPESGYPQQDYLPQPAYPQQVMPPAQPGYPYQPPRKPKKHRTRTVILIVVLIVVAIVLVPILLFLSVPIMFGLDDLRREAETPMLARSKTAVAMYTDCVRTDVEPGAFSGKAVDGHGKPVIQSYTIDTSQQNIELTPASTSFRLNLNGDSDMFLTISLDGGAAGGGGDEMSCRAVAEDSPKLMKALQKHYGDCLDDDFSSPHDGEPLCVHDNHHGQLIESIRECEDSKLRGSLHACVPPKMDEGDDDDGGGGSNQFQGVPGDPGN